MPGTVSIDREVLDHLRLGDEQALERLFREAYPTLTQRAQAELDDPSVAPRLVEGAFLRAWAERTHFETPEALERFLQQSVHQGAVRERSRRAALHRFEQREGIAPHAHAPAGPVDVPVDAAWAHVSAVLHAPPPDEAAATQQRIQHSRHEAAEHMVKVARRRPWMAPALIAAVLGLAVFGGMRWANRTSDEVQVSRALASQEARVRSTRSAERASMALLDGSQAVLGAESKLTVAPAFGDLIRALGLDGAGSFTVKPMERLPFHVRTAEAMIVATGTTFDVRAYALEGRTLVRVREGSVVVKAGGREESLAKGAAVEVRSDGSMGPVAPAAMGQAFGWVDGRLVLADQPLRAVLPQVKRWFGIDLHVADSTLLARKVSVDVDLGATRALLAQLEQSGAMKFDYDKDEQMVLRDAGAPPPTTKPTTQR